VSLGDGIGRESRHYGVLVQTCCPGRTDTDFHTTAGVKAYGAPGGQQTADEVVAESLAGLDRRRELVVTGWRNRLLMRMRRLVPRRVVLWAAERVLRPSREGVRPGHPLPPSAMGRPPGAGG
jgi:short-subunit dehydrogenase